MKNELAKTGKSTIAYVSDAQLENWKDNEELLTVINTHPRKEWIKKHPFNKKVDYLPVGKIEMLLDQIFGIWDFTVVDYKLIGNAVTVHIKLKVKNPKTGDWIERDGLGAVPLELEATEYDKAGNVTKQGAKHACDFEKLNRMAIMKNLPAAKSFALKDAADTLGNLFGRSLNRDKEDFKPIAGEAKQNVYTIEMENKIDSFENPEDLTEYVMEMEHMHENEEFMKAFRNKKTELENRKKQ